MAIATVLLTLAWPGPLVAADPLAQAEARQRLHQQQLQHSLDLSLHQSAARSRLQFSPAERARFDALARSQQLQQQRLHHEQLLRHQAGVDPASGDLRRRLAAQESALQLKRFEIEQRRFVDSAPPPALQPLPHPGRLELR
jgi:hypothetical protein